MIILKTRSEVKVKVTVTRKWLFLETRSEVKVKVTVTQLWYATLPHPKMHPHTKFGIPTSKNIGDMHRTRSGTDGLTDGQCDYYMPPKEFLCDTPSSQDASTYQIWNSYLKEYRRYAPDTKRDGRTDGRTYSAITICLPNMASNLGLLLQKEQNVK